MARAVIFDSPIVIGFETTRLLIERLNRTHDSYPPYNVEVIGEDALRITIAVAGFSPAQLKIEHRGRSLNVIASREAAEADRSERDFIHRGLALRGFVRGFVLGDDLDITGAHHSLGQLHIDLKRKATEDSVVNIPIRVI